MANFSWFKVVIPAVWDENTQGTKMPVQIGAMIDDGTPQPDFDGVADITIGSFGAVLALYDSGGVQLPGLRTDTFVGGGWRGFVRLSVDPHPDWLALPGEPIDLSLRATDPASGIGGGSTPVHYTSLGTPPPPPPPPPPPGGHAVRVLIEVDGVVVGTINAT